MKPQPIPSGSQRFLQAARCETERAPGCADTRCGYQLPAGDNAKQPENIRACWEEEEGSLWQRGARAEQHQLSRLGLSAGGGVVCCIAAESPAGILADAARNLPGAARGMLRSQIHHLEEGVSCPLQP